MEGCPTNPSGCPTNPAGFAAHSRWLRSASDDTTGRARQKRIVNPGRDSSTVTRGLSQHHPGALRSLRDRTNAYVVRPGVSLRSSARLCAVIPAGMNAGRSDRRSQRTQRGLTTTTKREQLLTRVARAAAALKSSRTLRPSVHHSRRDNRILNHGSVMPEPYPRSSPSAPLQTAGCTRGCLLPKFPVAAEDRF